MGLGVGLGGFSGMVCGVVEMALCDKGVMRGSMMVAGFMPGGGFAVVSRGVLVMFCGFPVMLNSML